MRRSLSALLPVYNGETTLPGQIEELLELLPELTPQFELVIVDDGSTDGTRELADEFAHRFPQVRTLGHHRPLGRAAALRTGARHAKGDVLFLRDDGCRLPLDQLGRLWRASAEYAAVLARPVAPHRPQWLRWLPEASAEGGYQFLQRAALLPIVESAVDQPSLMAALARRGIEWCEVELLRRTPVPAPMLPPLPIHTDFRVPIA